MVLLPQLLHAQNSWNLVWQEEFNYKGLPDTIKWNYDTRGNEFGWGNNEKQWYNVANIINTEVSNGTLKIRAIKDSAGNKAYSSGRLTTQHKGDWKYGKVEVRARLPKGNGTWPAIWMLSTDNSYGSWPASGEIDIMEHVGHYPDTVFATAHTGDFNHIKRTQVGVKTFLPTATTDFHVYGLEWEENEYRCYVDGLHYFTYKNNGTGFKAWPFDQPFYLILNLAIGGGLGGKKGIDDSLFPHTFEVDYVRVYQKKDYQIGQLIKNRQVTDTNLVLPPSWAFGMLYGAYTNQQQTIDRVSKILQKDYPIDAYWIDSWFWDHANKGKGPKKYIDFIADTIGFPDRKGMWRFLEQNHIKGGFWVWDIIQETGNEEAFKEFKDKGFFKRIYENNSSWHNSSTTTAMFEEGKTKRVTPTGDIDFNNPAAVALFKQRMKHFFDEGADFIKLDNSSAIEICKAMFEMTQEFGKETKGRGFILSHTGGQERPEYKKYPTKWTDDTRSDWTVETPLLEFNSWVPKVALKENIAMHLDPSKRSSEIPFLTNDLGGFDMGKTTQPEEELYIRWMQFSMMNAITEVFSQPENPTANMAWNYGSRADSLFRKYAHLRMQLFPYIYSHAHLARIAGKHILGKIPGHIYQYTLGDELLLAPVYEKGATTKDVFLPEGQWVNYWTGERMDGNRKYTVAAPIEQIPMFVKSGSIIPIRNYASSIEKGNNQTLNVSVYPGADGNFYLIEDDGSSNAYLTGGYAATLIEHKQADKKTKIVVQAVDGKYEGMPAKRNWKIQLMDSRKPISITCNQRKVKFKIVDDKMIHFEVIGKKVGEKLEIEIVYP
jgi:beta-glucanase (GH16 family)